MQQIYKESAFFFNPLLPFITHPRIFSAAAPHLLSLEELDEKTLERNRPESLLVSAGYSLIKTAPSPL